MKLKTKSYQKSRGAQRKTSVTESIAREKEGRSEMTTENCETRN